jgi:uncharacterized membrane protein
MDSEKPPYFSPLAILVLVLSLFAAFLTSVVLNIMIARQALGFLYLTFIPGFLLLRILRVKQLDWIEAVVLSVGLSLVFLMLGGLFINGFGPLIGFSKPLSTAILMVALNIAILSLCLIDYQLAKGRSGLVTINRVKLEPLAIVICCLPLLSVAGTYLVNVSPKSNFLLLAMLAFIALLVTLTASERLVPRRLYPILLLAIAIALLWQTSLVSSHINGFDIQLEYRFIETTVTGSRWTPNVNAEFQSLLSLTILPAIYCNLLALNGVWVLKIIYPLIFAFVPLALYGFFKKWVSERIAFLAAFFLMAYSEFFTEMLALGRQMIAEVFFVLLLYVLFSNKIRGLSKTVLFVLFGFSLIASHYAIAFIFMLIIVAAWFVLSCLNRNLDVKNAYLKVSYVILYCAMLFGWYIYVSSSATFNALLSVWQTVYTSLQTEFFSPASRGAMVLSGVGIGSTPSTLVQLVGRIFFYATEIFIVVGFLTLIIKRRNIFGKEYNVILSMGIAILVLSVVLPNFANTLNIERLYHFVLLIAAPLCILGGEAIFGFLTKAKKEALSFSLIFVILVPFFLFQSGFIYEIAKVQDLSIPLSKYRFGLYEYSGLGMIDDQDIFSVQWLYQNDINGSAKIYCEAGLAHNQLLPGGYGMLPLNRIEEIASNTTEVEANSLVFLDWADLTYGIMGNGNFYWNTSQYVNASLSYMNQIYSTGQCKIYENP